MTPNSLSIAQRFRTASEGSVELTQQPESGNLGAEILLIVLGCGLYGFSLGCWRGWEMGLYVAVKMPLLIFLTLGFNSLINGMLAQLLGSGLSFRQTLHALTSSYTLFSLLVGAFSPIVLAMVLLDAPAAHDRGAGQFHSLFLVMQTFVITYAGVTSNFRLLHKLETLCADAAIARRVLISWLAGNLFVGAQISFILRPFFGSPSLAVEFVRKDALKGNFYESLWNMASASMGQTPAIVAFTLVFFILGLCFRKHSITTPRPPEKPLPG